IGLDNFNHIALYTTVCISSTVVIIQLKRDAREVVLPRFPNGTLSMREKIVAEARSWIGTPYHNCADIKGVGVDCGMLLVRVFVDLGLVEPFDPRPYTHDWHMHRDEERYLNLVLPRARKVSAPQIGDVMLFRVGRSHS